MSDHRSETYARTLSLLIQAETVSAEGQTDLSKFHTFHTLLSQTFPAIFSRVELEEFDGSLLFRWPGTDSGLQPLLLMSHHDVVEAPGAWTHPPFSGALSDGKLWGRGTLDTKGNLWAMLQAADELAASGFTPGRNVYFVSTCCEEINGAGGDTISRVLQERGIRFSLVLDEGGMIMERPIAGAEGTFAMIGVGEKGCTDLKFIARSEGGHASTPGRDTPLVRLGKFMAAAERAKVFRAEISPTVREMFSRMAPSMSGVMKLVCGHPKLFGGLLTRALPGISPTAGAMVKTTLAFTMAQGSGGRNVLPQEAWVVGNMRFSHHQGRDGSIAAIRELAAQYGVETEILEPGFESTVSDFNSEGFHLVERAIGAVFPGVRPTPYVMTGASDSRFFSRVCDTCLRFAPFRITQQQLDSIHGLDENVDIDTLAPAVDFFKYILQEI